MDENAGSSPAVCSNSNAPVAQRTERQVSTLGRRGFDSFQVLHEPPLAYPVNAPVCDTGEEGSSPQAVPVLVWCKG